MSKIKSKRIVSAILAVVLCIGLSLTAFAATTKTAILSKGMASSYGGVIGNCKQVKFLGENYSGSLQDMRLVVKNKHFGVLSADYDITMPINSKIGTESSPRYSSYYESGRDFEISVHAEWAGKNANGYGKMQFYK